jgi:hypothetical protein
VTWNIRFFKSKDGNILNNGTLNRAIISLYSLIFLSIGFSSETSIEASIDLPEFGGLYSDKSSIGSGIPHAP